MYCYNMAGQRFVLPERRLEPQDCCFCEEHEHPSCQCSECGQDVWSGEYTYEGMCRECFEEHLKERMKTNLEAMAELLGYDVLLR